MTAPGLPRVTSGRARNRSRTLSRRPGAGRPSRPTESSEVEDGEPVSGPGTVSITCKERADDRWHVARAVDHRDRDRLGAACLVDRDQGVDEQRVPVVHYELDELRGDVAFGLRFARGQVVQAQVTAHNPACPP